MILTDKVGMAIKPGTAVSEISELVSLVDMVTPTLILMLIPIISTIIITQILTLTVSVTVTAIL